MSAANSRDEATATSGHGDTTTTGRHLHFDLRSPGFKFLIYVAIVWYFAICVTPALLYIDGCSAFVCNVFASVVVLPLSAPGLMADVSWNISRHTSRWIVAEYVLCVIGMTMALLVDAHGLLFAMTSSRPELLLLTASVVAALSLWFLNPVGLLEFIEAVFIDCAFLVVTAFYVHLGLVFVPVLYSMLSAVHLSTYIVF